MRFHVIGLPHTQTTQDFLVCAFTAKVINFCRMMMDRGHEVFLYSGEKNEAPCTEHITCITEEVRAAHVGADHYVSASFDTSSKAWTLFNLNAVYEIQARKQPKDFLCLIGGTSHKPIADANQDMLCVEFGVGYDGSFSKFKVFESYAWMHTCYGAKIGKASAVDGHWFDVVIPGYLDPAMFPLTYSKQDYYLFVGRLIDRKGYKIAIEVCKALGKRLIIAGPGALDSTDAEYVGTVGPEKRAELMGGAIALFAPTHYIEPFGNVAIEAMACGTPVLSTDWGAFTETVVHGETGYRCRTFGEFKKAAKLAKCLNPAQIRKHAVSRYSLNVIGKKYESYFNRLQSLWGAGWYEDAGDSLGGE